MYGRKKPTRWRPRILPEWTKFYVNFLYDLSAFVANYRRDPRANIFRLEVMTVFGWGLANAGICRIVEL